ncbi:hypothetical protein [Flavobacterium sp. 5]|uniref:hypothetical protein n=1 Tax=Flavobacterium sp. 5 TaxID=2035199 RepID=UPI000CB728D2|nr:hypothetical protein [Flavobacterium sp. 5]PKB15265.1 hypothetical protein CLU82_0329 [Flavobacterium sp. 5]
MYAYFGLAVYFGQVLEEAFSIMLWTNRIFKNQAKSTKEINDIIDTIENSKKTMGNLLNEVKQNYGLSEKHLMTLEDVLNRRNYIVHKFFKIEIHKFHSEIGKKEMIKYLCDFTDDTVEIDAELNQYFQDYKLRLGFTDARIDEIVAEMKEKELARDNK